MSVETRSFTPKSETTARSAQVAPAQTTERDSVLFEQRAQVFRNVAELVSQTGKVTGYNRESLPDGDKTTPVYRESSDVSLFAVTGDTPTFVQFGLTRTSHIASTTETVLDGKKIPTPAPKGSYIDTRLKERVLPPIEDEVTMGINGKTVTISRPDGMQMTDEKGEKIIDHTQQKVILANFNTFLTIAKSEKEHPGLKANK